MWRAITLVSILALFIGQVVFMIMRKRSNERSNHRFVSENFPVGETATFSGQLIVHWEVGRFDWAARGKLPGIGQGLSCELDWGDTEVPVSTDVGRGRGKAYNLEFRGRVLEKGKYGHLGMCDYRVAVDEVIFCEPA